MREIKGYAASYRNTYRKHFSSESTLGLGECVCPPKSTNASEHPEIPVRNEKKARLHVLVIPQPQELRQSNLCNPGRLVPKPKFVWQKCPRTLNLADSRQQTALKEAQHLPTPHYSHLETTNAATA